MMTRKKFLLSMMTAAMAAALPRLAAGAGSIVDLSGGVYTPDLSWDEAEIWCKNPDRSIVLTLPRASSLNRRWRVTLYKYDPTSNEVQIRVTEAGDRLNHFWDYTHPYGRFLNMTQQVAEISCDGVSDFRLTIIKSTPAPQSQRSLVVPGSGWALTPLSVDEIVRCNASAGAIGIPIDPVIPHWCPPSQVTGGNYHAFNIWVQKNDTSPNTVSLWEADGSRINPSNDLAVTGLDRGYLHLTQPGDTAQLYIAADGVRVINFYRPATGFITAFDGNARHMVTGDYRRLQAG